MNNLNVAMSTRYFPFPSVLYGQDNKVSMLQISKLKWLQMKIFKAFKVDNTYLTIYFHSFCGYGVHMFVVTLLIFVFCENLRVCKPREITGNDSI